MHYLLPPGVRYNRWSKQKIDQKFYKVKCLGRGIGIGNKGVKDLLYGIPEDSYIWPKLDEVSEKNWEDHKLLFLVIIKQSV